MPYSANNKNMLNKIEGLIRQNDEVLVEHYIKRYIQKYYLVNSFDMFDDLLRKLDLSDVVTVYKEKQLQIRGVLSKEFCEIVRSEYIKRNSIYYAFFCLEFYPIELEPYGAGSSLDELNEDVAELIDEYRDGRLKLCFGKDPRPINSKIHIDEDDEVIVIRNT